MSCQRLKAVVRGAVQGVGFRPYVYRLATQLHLKGWVLNSAQGVFIEVEGKNKSLSHFLARLEKEKPPRALIQSVEFTLSKAVGYRHFTIRESEESGPKTALILPDMATCADCLFEINDPTDRRYRYPFTNCTNCGPRFTIIEALPYDRPNTSMKGFAMCPECLREYNDPASRRFHAQPNACPQCGPQLELWDPRGQPIAKRHEALCTAAETLRHGGTLALKGIGGFQLLVDARNAEAIALLRERKHRESKPFALMYPSVERVRGDCRVSSLQEQLLLSPEAPIVLVEKLPESSVAVSVAPGNPEFGVMLPYSPLHHLLMRELGFPVVATSGNLSDEPICTDEREALQRLRGIADSFLVHNRPIVRHADDSVVRIMCEREMILRRARGYAPMPIRVKNSLPTLVALGAHLKNTVALSIGNNVFLSQHIGDLETGQAYSAFCRVIQDFQQLYQATPEAVACDLHPDYLSTQYASQVPGILCYIQHHWAHLAACMGENEIEPPALGVVWDGTGFGEDGSIWGGEFLLAEASGFRRVAHLRQFRLPGGDTAIKEPRRAALGLLNEIPEEKRWGARLEANFTSSELRIIKKMLANRVNSPLTSSAGRLFDAVAALIGLRQRVSFEGQAAAELEYAIQPGISDFYPHKVDGAPLVIDWRPMFLEILEDLVRSTPRNVIAAKFHNTLTEIIVSIAQKVATPKVLLTGGCFQNRYLTENSVKRLSEEGFTPYWHRCVPPNDGGISFGQVIAANYLLKTQQ